MKQCITCCNLPKPFRQHHSCMDWESRIDVKGDPFWAEAKATLLVVSSALYAGLEFGLHHFC